VFEQSSFQQVTGLPYSHLEAAVDWYTVAFITHLVDQNVVLTNRLNQLASKNALAEEIVTKALEVADEIGRLAEKEANNRGASIIQEFEKEAKAEAERIVNDSIKQAVAIEALKESDANDRAAAIIRESEAKAKAEANRILAEARERAGVLVQEETRKAEQYGLLIIDQARAKAVSLIDEADAEISVLMNKAVQKLRR
jgi:vacuolar-type H+-ATPase subunit H